MDYIIYIQLYNNAVLSVQELRTESDCDPAGEI